MTTEDLIKTLDTYEEDYSTVSIEDCKDAMIEFARLKVTEALETVKQNVVLNVKCGYGTLENQVTEYVNTQKEFKQNSYGHGDSGFLVITVDQNSITYPLEIIK